MAPTLITDIHRTLEDDILHLRILPGTMLSENSLCERFEVSRTPIRSALQMLQSQRLVEILPHKGTCVTRLRYDLVSQIIYQRVATESAILRDFAPICDPQQIVQLRHYLAIMEKERDSRRAGQPPDTAHYYKVDQAMHEVWYRATRKPYLWEYISEAKADYQRFCMLDMRGGENYEDTYNEHVEIVRILEEQDLGAIEPLLKRHLNGGIRRLGARVYTDLKEYFDPASL